MNIAIFEDENYNNFYPISLTKPIWEIRSGCFLQRERFELLSEKILNHEDSGNIYYFTRTHLVPLFKEKYPDLKINDYSLLDIDDDILFVNSRVNIDETILKIEKNVLFKQDDIPLVALIESGKVKKDEKEITKMLMYSDDIIKKENNFIKIVEFIWDFVINNYNAIIEDFKLLKKKYKAGDCDSSTIVIGDKENLFIEDNVRIDPFVCLDLTDGPIIIRSGTVINSFTRIEGPCYIGKDCIILGAKIREGCSFGDNCRIGGEIEKSIFHSYSNKYHDGFIGHSYIGEWVNLGALTTNSDLKNNYNSIKVYIPEIRVDTKSIKVGCFVGDFTKTSIGTLINTGSSIGVGSMLVHSGTLAPYHIPSFSWYINNQIIEPAFFTDFLETCKIATSRRKVDFSKNHERLLNHVYKASNEIREKEISKWKRIKKLS